LARVKEVSDLVKETVYHKEMFAKKLRQPIRRRQPLAANFKSGWQTLTTGTMRQTYI